MPIEEAPYMNLVLHNKVFDFPDKPAPQRQRPEAGMEKLDVKQRRLHFSFGNRWGRNLFPLTTVWFKVLRQRIRQGHGYSKNGHDQV